MPELENNHPIEYWLEESDLNDLFDEIESIIWFETKNQKVKFDEIKNKYKNQNEKRDMER